MAVLVVADVHGNEIDDSTHKTVTAAQAISGDVDILIAGSGTGPAAEQAAKISGVRKVLHADNEIYAHRLAEPLAALIVNLAGEYDALLKTAATTGKNVMPRVAALLDVMQISEIVSVDAPDTFTRPIYAGNAMQTVKSNDAKKVITVRATSFKAAEEGGSAAVESVDAAEDPGLSSWVSENLTKSDRPELTGAKIVVSGGGRSDRQRNSRKLSFRLRINLAPPSARPVQLWMRAMCLTTIRSAKPARLSRRNCMSPSAFPVRSNTSPA